MPKPPVIADDIPGDITGVSNIVYEINKDLPFEPYMTRLTDIVEITFDSGASVKLKKNGNKYKHA